jgi:hypothetical protein
MVNVELARSFIERARRGGEADDFASISGGGRPALDLHAKR